MLKIASAEADITPRVGIDLSGFALRQNPSKGVADPLKIRWLCLTDSHGQKVLLGAADVLSFSRTAYRSMRDAIKAALGDSVVVHVALATSHTHSGPATVKLRHCGAINKPYFKHLKRTIVRSAIAAANAPADAVDVAVGSSDCPLNMNRRNETVPVDHAVQVVQFLSRDSDKRPLASIVNYACHPVVAGHGNVDISADYPGALCRAVEEQTHAPCLFLNGVCGDVNPRDAHFPDTIEAHKMGLALARAAIEAAASAVKLEDCEINWRTARVELPVNVPDSISVIEDRLDMLQSRFGLSRALFADRVERDRKTLAEGVYPKTIPIELALLGFGDKLAILFVPGELFSSIGFRAKELAAPRQLLIAGFSNGSVGYLSDRQAYEDGGYEPCFANFFYDFPEFDPSLEDSLLAGIGELLKRNSLEDE